MIRALMIACGVGRSPRALANRFRTADRRHKTPVPKASLATRVGDLGCGVGYYK
jgi:hypothetical protein